MNKIRVKLGSHVLIVITSILVSSFAVASSANWIKQSTEVPAYVTLAQYNIEYKKQEDAKNATEYAGNSK